MHIDLKSLLGLVAFTLLLAVVAAGLSACAETRSLPGYAAEDGFKAKDFYATQSRQSGGSTE